VAEGDAGACGGGRGRGVEGDLISRFGTVFENQREGLRGVGGLGGWDLQGFFEGDDEGG
jgi:hypothetical protein